MNLAIRLKSAFIALFAIIAIILTGCGGGSSGQNGDTTLKAALCPGKLSFENGSSENILFASARGSGVSTGWVENQTGNKTGDNLSYVRSANAYETMIRGSKTPLTTQNYTLKYFVGSEQFTLKKDQISWVGIPDFFSTPTTPTWDSSFKRLTVNLPGVSGGNASYYLRLYYAASPDTIYEQSSPQSGGLITMQVNIPDDYLIMLIADVIEKDQVIATTRHVFKEMSLK